MNSEIIAAYGTIFEKELIDEIINNGKIMEVDEGEVLINHGSYLRNMPLLLEGVIKIIRIDEKGDELLLYFLEKGDTCAMTLNCCMGMTKSEITAISETKSKLIMLPVQYMELWTAKYKSWRNFVFESYHARLLELLETIDSIAFLKMDERLLKYLSDKAEVTNSNTIKNTHQQIALELNTSRVVISRLLKTMENQGLIEMQRQYITLLET